MPIDAGLLATSIQALGDLEPEPDLPASLRWAVTAAKQLLDADAAGITLTDASGGWRWASGSDQRALVVEDDWEAAPLALRRGVHHRPASGDVRRLPGAAPGRALG